MRVGIVGAGHAGVAAAETAAKGGAQVVLFSAEATLPYFRPRIVGVAVGSEPEEAIFFHPRQWFTALGIDLRLDTPVEAIEVLPEGFAVRAGASVERFDRLILATGAGPLTPPLYAVPRARLSPLWTLANARDLAAKLVPGTRLCVVGGGILGLELALSAADRPGVAVALIEREPRLMRAQLSECVASALKAALAQRAIEVLVSTSIDSLEERPEALCAHIAQGGARTFDQVVYALGARASLALARQCGLAVQRGVQVDASLATSIPGIFACGDVAEIEGITRSIAVEAVRQGRVAGENAAGGSARYQSGSAALSYRHPGLEILAIGPSQPEGAEVREVPVEGGLCALVIAEGQLVGVQALNAREAFRQYERRLGQEL